MLNSSLPSYIFGIASVLLVSAIALATLPSGTALRVVVIALVIGLATTAIGSLYRFSILWSLAAGYRQLQTPIGNLIQPLESHALGDFTLIDVLMIALVLIIIFILALRYSNFNLRAKLISATAIVAILAVLGVTIFISQNTRSFLTEKIGEDLHSLAGSQALSLGELLARQVNVLETLSLNRGVIAELEIQNETYSGDPASIVAELEEVDQIWRNAADDHPLIVSALNNNLAANLYSFHDTFPEHVEVFVTDKFGALIATNNRTSDYYQADEAWWQEAYNEGEGGIHIGEPEFDESSDTLGINMAVPIFSVGSREIVGILRTTYSLDSIANVCTKKRYYVIL